ncbi:hypothetical protein [Streptomyces kanamyceticus]|uniref:Protein TolB n=1 Tax=Streptomyces kanamyceticus TaxID=1967 RepID=A0A5J6GAF9_STRKN|nr:hypothetical protein [Streptomyces kanamyceticus]QEU90811.1 hypothetical protein CP970_07775 [Streptomyces kanamyceticus]
MSAEVTRSTTRRARAALGAAVAVCAVTVALPGVASAEPAGARGAGVERISVAADGTQADGDSADASITHDGRRVIFSSSATNLTADAASAGASVYVRDQRTGQNQRMGDLSPIGPPVISGDGEYIGYAHQWITNVRIRQYQMSTGRTASLNCSAYTCDQASLNTDGRYTAHVVRYPRQPTFGQRIEVQDWNNGGANQNVAVLTHSKPSKPSISGDGRYVAYQDGQTEDVFLWDRTGATTSGPIEGPDKAAALVQLSDDGGKVVYLSGSDTYVHDVRTGTAQLLPNAKGVAIDPTGRYLLYAPRDTSGPALTLRDLRTGTDEIISDQPASAGTDAVSTGGRDVVFQSAADNIVPGDTNGKSDVFARHLY